MATTKKETEKTSGKWWIFGIGLILIILGITLSFDFSSWKNQMTGKTNYDAKSASTDTTFAVQNEWVEKKIPPNHEFNFIPEKDIKVKNIFGVEYTITPDGKVWNEKGEETTLGTIPNRTLSVKSKFGTKVQVALSTWPSR